MLSAIRSGCSQNAAFFCRICWWDFFFSSLLSLFFFFWLCIHAGWDFGAYEVFREIDIEIHVYRDNIIASCYHLPTNVLDLSQGLCCCLVKYIILLVTGQIISSLLGICTPKLRTPAEHQCTHPLSCWAQSSIWWRKRDFGFWLKAPFCDRLIRLLFSVQHLAWLYHKNFWKYGSEKTLKEYSARLFRSCTATHWGLRVLWGALWNCLMMGK